MSDTPKNTPIVFNTALKPEEFMGACTDILNKSLYITGSAVLSLGQDVNASLFVDLCSRPTPDTESRAHPISVVLVTGAMATALRKFMEEAGVATNHRELFLDMPPVEAPAETTAESVEAPEASKIVIP